jgi:hypothetical protein
MMQLVSAVSIFDQMDTDGTEKLDRRELYEKVIQVVDQHMEGRKDRKGNKVPCTQEDKDNISMVRSPDNDACVLIILCELKNTTLVSRGILLI